MSRTEPRRGAREIRLGDWPFGSHGRRLFLTAVLVGRAPAAGWSKHELEKLCEVERGGVDRLLAGAQGLGLIKLDGGRWVLVSPQPAIAEPLRRVLRASEPLADTSIAPIARRRYGKPR